MLTRSKMSAESLQKIYQMLNDLKEDLKNKATIKNIEGVGSRNKGKR